jgi:hypothetical protein
MGMSTALRNATLDSGYDAVFNSGSLEFRTGSIPTDADQAPTGSVLATVAPRPTRSATPPRAYQEQSRHLVGCRRGRRHDRLTPA